MKRPQHLNKPAAETEKRNFSRLDLNQEPALSAVLVLPDRSAFYTPLRNLSANGFSCELPRVVSVKGSDPVYTEFLLPFKEPTSVNSKAFLVMKSSGKKELSTLHFRFSEGVNAGFQDLLHRYIIEE